ncbi:hypothetical protein ACFO5X_21175, partial [Seohaeicola nanhaiensis]
MDGKPEEDPARRRSTAAEGKAETSQPAEIGFDDDLLDDDDEDLPPRRRAARAARRAALRRGSDAPPVRA